MVFIGGGGGGHLLRDTSQTVVTLDVTPAIITCHAVTPCHGGGDFAARGYNWKLRDAL